MRTAVVGAGVAGLTFAAWLGRAGVDCTVFEQAAALTEMGAGIQLSPNAVRLLHRLGLADELAAVAVRPDAVEVRRWRDGRVIGWTELGPRCAELYGGPYYTMLRTALQHCLVNAVEPGRIRLGQRCVGLRETLTGVELSLAAGTVDADLVVGADGIGSVVRHLVSPDERRSAGRTVHRGLIPIGRLTGPRPARVTVFLGPDRHCVWYPVTADLVSLAVVVPGTGEPDARRGASDRDQLLAEFAGWHPEVREVLGAADELTRWSLHDRAPLARWGTGRVTMIGDAAHPMLPFAAQGANQAIESAVTLATCLTRDGLPDALVRYERVRTPRLEQLRSTVEQRGRDQHLPDGPAQARRDLVLGAVSTLDAQAWLFGYDAEAACGLARVP